MRGSVVEVRFARLVVLELCKKIICELQNVKCEETREDERGRERTREDERKGEKRRKKEEKIVRRCIRKQQSDQVR